MRHPSPYNYTGLQDFLAPAQRFGARESRLRKEAARMMHRLCRVVFAIAGLGIAVGAGVAHAQEEDEGIVFEEDKVKEPPPESDPNIEMDEPGEGEQGESTEPDLAGDLAGVDQPVGAGQQAGKLGEDRVSWQDIVVVVRKPFLKLQRIELMPMVGVTMNDNLISHVQFGGQVSYYLTDVLAVGAEGYVYAATLREPFDEVAFQARRLPAVNQYNYSAALNFSYVPIYGKFAILDQHIIHWESYFTGGVGFTQSEVIPRDPAFQPFTNFLVTPNVGVSMRFFLTKFLTVTVGLRDYIFIDQFEPADRAMYSNPEAAKENADSVLINHLMFQAGVSFWWPMGFEYTTFR
jgi:outer membrane beta-barrel protein